MDLLHSRDQEAVDLLHYLWKAYKAAPDIEFVTYIKDLKSQAEDGHATFTMEELMTRPENKYKARLLGEENAWGQLSDDHEKIIAMSMEIDLLKKNCQTNFMPKVTGKDKKKSTTASSSKNKDEGKKNKWAWKDEPPKTNGLKEDSIHIRHENDKKYYWCTNHNDNKGKWVIHHLLACKNAARG